MSWYKVQLAIEILADKVQLIAQIYADCTIATSVKL